MYNDELKHYGTPHIGDIPHSGRYKWGSGKDPLQNDSEFLDLDATLRKEGLSEVERAAFFRMKSTKEFREYKRLAKEQVTAANVARAVRLKEKRYSTREIGRIMGKNESVIRKYLKYHEQDKLDKTKNTAEMLKKQVEQKGMIQVGSGVERMIGISQTQLNAALTRLNITDGLEVHTIFVDQMGMSPGNKTTVKVLTPKGTALKDVYSNMDKIHNITEYSHDSGKTWANIKYPKSISSDRILINYSDSKNSGSEKDGVIELRRNVPDLSLGESKYAQVRILVDDDHYAKGMAIYSDDIPKGYDIVFNTNKDSSKSKLEVLKGCQVVISPKELSEKLGISSEEVAKKLKDRTLLADTTDDLVKLGFTRNQAKKYIDKDNPFGASIKLEKKMPDGSIFPGGQYEYIDRNGKKQLGAINKVNDEGDWGEWKRTIASQVLSKQSIPLAKRQLDITYDDKKAEFDEIMSLTNPAVKKKLLQSFSDDCDSSAVDLKAAAFPRQASCVILPVPELKPTEIYAPRYNNGETVALVRYPHGGIFEIPVLRVNNHNKEAEKTIGQSADAVCINSKVAEQLSGADFDGDSVLVIPTNKTPIKSSKPLEGLKDFDPKSAYPAYPGMPKMKPETKQNEMGRVSNLITDMTLKGADIDEISRAVKHSMVVIDAEKHNLNYKQSEKDFGIKALKVKYQGGTLKQPKGASTLISQASSEYRVPYTRRELTNINKMTPTQKKRYLAGEKIFEKTNQTYNKKIKNKNGEYEWVPILRQTKSTRMAEERDAYNLSSGTRMENLYADYANKMKALANEARKEYRNTPSIVKSPSAAKTYAKEVKSLDNKLDTALKNAPYEKQAQMLANIVYKARREANPDLDKDGENKLKTQTLTEARKRVGAKSRRERNITITDQEWSAIQAGAISNSKLEKILNNTDLDELRKRATPRQSRALTPAQVSRIKSLMASGYSASEIANRLGISVTTVYKANKQ